MFHEETKKTDECDMEKFGTPDRSEKTIAILGGRWWPQAVKQEEDTTSASNVCNRWKRRQ